MYSYKFYGLITVSIFLSLPMAYASVDMKTNVPNPQIEKCRSQAQPKLDSGITATMREGAMDYSKCLEATILNLAEHIYPNEQQKKAKAEIAQQLGELSRATVGFYWKLQNENQWCGSSCGTMWHVTPYAPYHAILEKMIQDMLATEQLYAVPK